MGLNLISKATLFLLMILNLNCSSKTDKDVSPNVLIDIGDSLTAGAGGDGTSMSSVTATLLGEKWEVKNMGVGGENTLTIGARYGAIPMYLKDSITIPKGRSKIAIPSGLYSSYNDSNIFPLLQGDAGINPCYIDGIEFELTIVDSTYYLKRAQPSSNDYIMKAKSKIMTSLSKETNGIATIFIGQNGGFNTTRELVDQINLFVEHKGDDNVIIITSHGNGYPDTVNAIYSTYGNKLIDLKKYMSSKAIYDAIEYGLLPDDQVYPTPEDLEQMAMNNAPPSLLIDGIHFNPIGYELLGRLRFEKGKELGYW